MAPTADAGSPAPRGQGLLERVHEAATRSAGRLALGYLVLGSLWILGSDALVWCLASFAGAVNPFAPPAQLAKGLLFMVVTSGALFLFARRQTRALLVERARRSADLEERAARLHRALEFSHEGSWDWDLEAERMEVTEACFALLGYTPGAPGTPDPSRWLDMVHPDDRPDIERLLEDHFEGRAESFVAEFRMRAADGGWVWVRSRGRVGERSPDGAPRRMTGTLYDVTEEKNLRARLAKGEKLQALGQLTSGIAHDFNNMLAVVTGQLELALEDLPEDHPCHAELRLALGAALDGRDVIRKLLVGVRPQEGEPEPVLLGDLLRERADVLRAELPEGTRLELDLPESPLAVRADPSWVHQAVSNLVRNAGEARHDPGGTVSVRLAAEEDAEDAPRIQLSVLDEGPGVPEELQERIFDPFLTTKPPSKGSGLGLWMVRNIAEGLGGTIRVENREEGGACFHLSLPRVAAAPAPRPPPEELLPEDAPAPGHVLLVDDDPDVLRIQTLYLERLGYTVAPAPRAREALELFRADPDAFQLLMTDQTMPEMSGLELASAVKEERPDLPVILHSGFGDLAHPAIDAILPKPATRAALLEILGRVLPRAAGRAPGERSAP